MRRQSTRALFRSADLPTTRGTKVRLPPLLDGDEAQARYRATLDAPGALIALDLFAGAGGMSSGFQDAGFTIAAAIDADPEACETHAANFLCQTLCRDIAAIDRPERLMEELGIPRVDVIIGGPPCQGFSIAGLGKVRSLSQEVQEEIAARNQLYREYLRFVAALQPRLFVLENVPQLDSHADGIIAEAIHADGARLGYYVEPIVLDASHFGVPQTRRRLFFIGSRDGKVLRLPRATHGAALRRRTLADAIADLPAIQAPTLVERQEYVPRDRPDLQVSPDYVALLRSRVPPAERGWVYDHIVRPVRDDDREIFAAMSPGGRYRDVDPRYRRYEIKRSLDDREAYFDDRYYRLRWEEPSPTITAHIAKDGYRYIYPDNDQIRTLSVREAARIQSFPDHFRFAGFRTGRYRQIGNAVPPLLAEALGRSLARSLKGLSGYQRLLPALMDEPLLEAVEKPA